MKIYRTNGEIVELNTAEYRELFIENAPVGCSSMCSIGDPEENPEPAHEAEASKEESEKPVFAITPTSERGCGGQGGHTSSPTWKFPENPSPSDLLEPEPSAGGKNKKKLDDGKIAALRRAGWTFEKIADEMGCSTQTALNHYNAYIKNVGR